MVHPALLILLLLLRSTVFAHPFPVGATVKTSSGPILGYAARNRTRVSEYLGIPYAKPPLGDLRFAAPQSYASSKLLNAATFVGNNICILYTATDITYFFLVPVGTELGIWSATTDVEYRDCPQIGLKAPPAKYPNQTPQFNSIISAFAGGRGNAQSEDCLTLNIWTKHPNSRKRKGVLVWIHGGSTFQPLVK